MPGFLFWNLHGVSSATHQNRPAELCASFTRLVKRHSLDVLIFAECDLTDGDVSKALNDAGVGTYVKPWSRSEKVHVWTRLPEPHVRDCYQGRRADRVTIRSVQFTGSVPILLVGAHLQNRQTLYTEISRAERAWDVARAVRLVDTRERNDRTILVGDLNMNPYEAGVVGTKGLHAVMTKDLARSVSVLSTRENHLCFYNPMWGCFGDVSPGPPGTHFFPSSQESTNHFWQIYDQLLIRPALIDQFVKVEILDGDGQESFVTRTGRPRVNRLSDHLPLYFEFDFTR
jgi:exonuclease III